MLMPLSLKLFRPARSGKDYELHRASYIMFQLLLTRLLAIRTICIEQSSCCGLTTRSLVRGWSKVKVAVKLSELHLPRYLHAISQRHATTG